MINLKVRCRFCRQILIGLDVHPPHPSAHHYVIPQRGPACGGYVWWLGYDTDVIQNPSGSCVLSVTNATRRKCCAAKTSAGKKVLAQALAVELTGTGQLNPGLEGLGYRLVEQRTRGVARVVELGLCTRLPANVRMRVRWACSGGHGAVPA